jgi:hypothetical protein
MPALTYGVMVSSSDQLNYEQWPDRGDLRTLQAPMNCGSNLRSSERKVNFRETARTSYQLISQVSIIAFCTDLSGLLSLPV